MNNWELTTLGEEVSLLTGFPFKSERYTSSIDDVKLLRGDNIIQGVVRWDGVKRWPRPDMENYATFLLAPGDVVLAMDRPWIEAGLKYARIDEHDLPCLLVQRAARLRAGHNLDQGFLRYLIGSREFTQYIRGVETGTAVPHISGNQIKAFRFPRPPLAEQRAISRILGSLDDKIELNRRMNTTLEAITRTLFQSWFVNFDPVRAKGRGQEPDGISAEVATLFPKTFEESKLGQIPKGWKVGTVSDIATLQNGFAFKSKDWQSDGVPVVKIGSVKPGIVDLEQVSFVSEEIANAQQRYRLSVGDLLIGMTGYVGEVGLIPPTKTLPLLNQRVGKFILAESGTARLGHLYCLTRNPAFKRSVEMSSQGSAQANVSASGILSIAIVLPPIQVREAFDLMIKPILDLILHNHAEVVTLSAMRDRLLPSLISGQLRVHV